MSPKSKAAEDPQSPEALFSAVHSQVFLVMEFVEHDLRTLMEQRNIRFTAPEVKCLAGTAQRRTPREVEGECLCFDGGAVPPD